MISQQRRSAGGRPSSLIVATIALSALLGACTGSSKNSGTVPSVPATVGSATAAAGADVTEVGGAPSPPSATASTANALPQTAVAAASASPAVSAPAGPPPPTATPAPRVLVPDATPAAGKVDAGVWAQVNTQGGCLRVRVSFEPDSLAVDCLPYKLLVFVDGTQAINGSQVAHLAGRGYVYPEGLTATDNPAENKLAFVDRPHDFGRVAYTTPDGNLWTIGADGANPLQISGAGADKNLNAYYSALAWSPDGAKLLLRREADTAHDLQLYQAGKGLSTLYPPPGATGANPGVTAWSADSYHVLVADYPLPGAACERTANSYVLRSVDIASGVTIELYRGSGNGYVAGLAAAADGRSIAVLLGAACDSSAFSLCLLSLQADANYRVQAGQLRCPPGAMAGQVAWSPDSKWLAFTSRLQGRDDESQLSVGLPIQVMEPRGATYYPLAWPLRYDRNFIGAVWLPESRTVRLEEEAPRGLTDTALPDRVVRRVTVDGSRFPITELAADRLTSVRALLSPGTVHAEYTLATGARGELWVAKLGEKDARWQLTDSAAGLAAWTP